MTITAMSRNVTRRNRPMRLNDAPATVPPTDTPTPPSVIARLSATARIIDWSPFALAAVTIIAFALRIFNLNWDVNNHLHPDERAITMHAQCLGLQSVPLGCTPVPDPANPHFFAY